MKNISKFYDSVEIGSHPTIENPGKGLGIKCFSDRDLYSTLFIAFGKKYETIEASNSSEYDILEIPFNHLPLRTKTSSIGKVYRIVLKTMVISSFIVRALFSLRGVHYKLINIHSLMLLPLLIFVGRKKKVITFRGSDFDFFKKSKIMRLMALVCDEFHCVSYAQCAFLEQHFKKRITIINNMVDVRFFESPMTQSRLNKKNLIVIAGLRYVKGVDLSLKTFKSLSDQDPNWVLNICGDGPEMHSLKCWCKDHGISNKVRFHGSVTRSELRNIINLSCICMIDSRNEGFPKAMLEALAGGCYIVHSGKGECSRVLRGFGFEYNVFNADVVSKHILTISSDVDNFMLKTQEALKIANKYSIEAYCSRIEGSYKRWLRPESCG